MNDFVDTRRAEVVDLCRRLNVRRLDAFGSAMEGTFNAVSSDLDFLVEFEAMPPPRYADAYFSLKEGLEALFGREVDLISAQAIMNPYFRERVEATRERIYAA